MEITKEQKEYCQDVAQVAYNQLLMSVEPNVVWSWGVSQKSYTFFKEMPTLMLKVQGFLHKGWVFVSLNEACDTYEVRLFDNMMSNCKAEYTDVYCCDLGKFLDSIIEKPLDMSDEDYAELVTKTYSTEDEEDM